MGKSKRIRSDRAQNIMTSPEKYSDIKAAKKAKRTTIILVCIIAAIVLATVALIIFNESGALARTKVLYETENFKINGAMATYMYYNTYQIYYSYYGEYLQYFGIDIASEVTSSAKTILARCEAAKAAGYDLTEVELNAIDEQIKAIKADCKEHGYSISDMYGEGVTASDIKKVLKLQKLASKIYTDKEDVFSSAIVTDTSRIEKYFEDNKAKFLIGDYIKVSVADKDYFNKLKTAKTAEEFKAIFIEYYVEKNLLTNYNAKVDPNVTSLDKSVFDTAEALINFYLYDVKIDGVELEAVDIEIDELKITKETFKKVYDKFKAADDTTTEAMMETLGTVTAEMCGKVDSAVTVKADYAYQAQKEETTTTTSGSATDTKKPTDDVTTDGAEDTDDAEVPTDSANDTETPSDTDAVTGGAAVAEETVPGTDDAEGTDAEGTDTASTTTKKEETTKAPTSTQLTNEFNAWFFSGDRKEGDIFGASDEKSVYFVTEPATKETYITKTVGHILVKVDDTKDTAAMAEAKAKAQDILNQYKSGTHSKDEFENHAKTNTEDSNVFYKNFQKGQMVEAFENWAYDEARKPGDTGIVETEYGYHVMYFVGDGLEAWVATAVDGLVDEDLAAWDKEIATTYPVTVNQKNVTKIFG